MISLDGYFAGSGGELNWHNVDAEFNNEFAVPQLKSAGLLMFGRMTYDLMASYWPTEQAIKNDPVVAGLMNGLPKLVFSTTIEQADWNNTKVVKEIRKLEIEKLKQETAKDILILGSGNIVQQFAKLGLIDEYRLMINPVALGVGKTLFADKIKFKLLKSREFKNGNVLLCYAPSSSLASSLHFVQGRL